MKKAVLIWQIPMVAGEKYSPLEYAIHQKPAKKFVSILNQYFLSENLSWQAELDDTAADIQALSEKKADFYIFVPGAKTRCWMYLDEFEKSEVPLYFLEAGEYNSGKIEKIKSFF